METLKVYMAHNRPTYSNIIQKLKFLKYNGARGSFGYVFTSCRYCVLVKY